MITEGIYRIYKLRFDENGDTHRRLAARLRFVNGQCVHLENHHDIDDHFPEGPITPQMERRFSSLSRSGYFEVIHEQNVASGLHPEEVEPLDVGEVQPDHRFVMTGDGVENPALVELWHDVIMVDGRKLDENEAAQVMAEVQAGRLHLMPID